GVMKENLEISLSSIAESQLPKLDRGMTNVTDSFSGYRFLPHGEHFDGKGAKVVLGYDRTKIPSGYTEDDIRTYYYDEQSGHWVALERDSVDRAHRMIVSHTTHFTDMINGVIQAPESPETQGFAPTMMSDLQAADPTAKVQMIEAPQANSNGTASLSYSLEMPPARNGMAPNLSIQYSSDAGSGWLGEGWNLSTSSISVDTRWGVPRYNKGTETETYLLDGQMLLEDGVGLAHRNMEQSRKSGIVKFHPRKESAFSEIVRIGDKPSNYIWEVTDRRGTKYTYGAYKITETKDEYGDVTKDTSIVGVVMGNNQYKEKYDTVISEWRLTRIEEIHGDYVEYTYREEKEEIEKDVNVVSLYLDSVKVGNAGEKPHTVVVLKNREGFKTTRRYDARYGYLTASNKLLESVDIYFEGKYLRGYKFDYKEGAFGVDLLTTVSHLGADGNVFNSHTLGYKPLGKDLYEDTEVTYTDGKEESLAEKITEAFFEALMPGYESDLSMINGTVSTDGLSTGGGANLGVAVVFGGASFTYGHNTGVGKICLTDLNGDGLPDKVYTDERGNLHYQPAIWGSNTFGLPVEIPGAPKSFSESSTSSNAANEDVGVGYNVASGSVTFDESWDITKVKSYFSDVNNDGLLDIVYHGKVYFNHLEKGHPVFSSYSSQTENTLGEMSLDLIETEKVTYTDEDLAKIEDSLKRTFPLHDVVRVWCAPFTGIINIRGNLSVNEKHGKFPDGIKFYVQRQEEVLLPKENQSNELNEGENVKTDIDDIFVEKDDYIFFRLSSVMQGDSDVVSWAPSIEYTKFLKKDNNGYVADNTIPETDENGNSLKAYSAEADFIGGQDSMMVIKGGCKISLVDNGYKKTGKTLDDIQLNIQYRLLGNEHKTWTQPINISAEETHETYQPLDLEVDEVKEGDTLILSFYTSSDIPFDPRIISWNPAVRTDYSQGGTLSNEEGIDTTYITPAHTMLNYIVSAVTANTVDIDLTNVKEDETYVFDEGHDGEFKVGIEATPEKIQGKYLKSYIYDEDNKTVQLINDGDYLSIADMKWKNIRVITYADTIVESTYNVKAHLMVNKQITVQTEDNKEETEIVTDTIQTIESSLYGKFDSKRSQMGLLFRGWGQFAYKGDHFVGEDKLHPVETKAIQLSELFAKTDMSEEDQKKLEGILAVDEDDNDLSDEEKLKKMMENLDDVKEITGTTQENTFHSMYYDSKNKRFCAGSQMAYISSAEMSSSRLGNPIIDVASEISTFTIEPSKVDETTGEKLSGSASAPDLYSRAVTTSATLGGGATIGHFDLGASASYSKTTTYTHKSFMDLNGDGYPDWLTEGADDMKVQYTRTNGVLESGHHKKGFLLPVQEAEATSIGASGKGGPAKAQSNKGSISWSIANLKAMAKEKANSASSFSINASGNISGSSSHSEHEWADVNGDGLPDMVYNDHVELNVGYRFIRVNISGEYGKIDASESRTFASGNSFSAPLCGSANISLGRNSTYSENTQIFTLMDINGDGLPDKVQKNGDNYYAYINRGFKNGFSDAVFISDRDIIKSKSTSISHHGNGGATIPAWIFTITPFGNAANSSSVSRTLASMSDFDGDGFPDLLESEDENSVSVRRSKIGATNKLTSVTNPFGGKFTIEYAHTTPTTDHPGGKWAMSSLTVSDATGMNPAMKSLFSYEEGKHDRREREFLGFGKVTTTSLDENGNPVRSAIAKYDVQHFLTAGAPIRNLVVSPGKEKDEKGNLIDIKHKEDITAYTYFTVTNGSELEATNIDHITEMTSLFSAPKERKTIAYEYQYDDETKTGTQEELELTHEAYDYTDSYGNLSAYSFRDLTNKTDKDYVGYDDAIQYANQKLGLATSVEVKGSDGALYRKVTAEYKDKNTPTAMTKMVQHLDGGKKAEFTFKYDQYGNMVRRTFPTEGADNEGDRSFFEYEYEQKYHMYPERVTDAFGYHSELEDYDYRYGTPRTVRDMNGYTVRYHIDDLGRTDTIVAPIEQSNGTPYTISYKYVLDKEKNYALSYAVTNHYDPQHPDNPLQTITHVDGLGRPYQVKKDAEIYGEGEKMIVSGRVKYDALGRTIETYQPSTCALADATKIVAFNDKLLNLSTYDAIDRPLTQTLPGDESGDADLNLKGAPSVTVMTYSIEDGLMKTTVKDPKDNNQYSYTNGAGQTVRTARDYMKMKDEDSESMEEKVYGIDYAYDPIGQLLTVTDAGGNVTSYTYDMAGRKLSVEHPSAGLTTFAYDVAGNIVKKQTPNLTEANKFITYTYHKNRLEKVTYPDHGENDVTYTYGGVNAPYNRVGRLALIEDGSGATEFFYGRMGEVTKQRRTLVIPNQAVATYTTEWTYDSHNRIQTMTYPDNEVVSYRYNLGGLLSSVSGKKDYTYDYVEEIGYDEYEQKKHMKYGNGVETTYDYSDERRRLKTLVVSNQEGEIMNNAYFYDNLDNITKLVNSAVAQKTKEGKTIGGGVTHNYTYDAWNRLIKAQGIYSGAEEKSAKYDLFMAYDELYNVTSKRLNVEQTNLQFPGTLKAGHTLKYQYDRENNDPFRLLSVSASEYRVAVE
ncbi:MAG: hypothetical protein J6T28_03395, partial [Paludibacteraceae bacterium]|nr:hypothetical protein [Paludibacteraceae bacterium]